MKKRVASCGLSALGLAALACAAPAFGAPAFGASASAALASSDAAAGVAAFRHGRFAEAYDAWTAAAAAGDARAARYLGVMYDTGEGVRQDQRRAVAWYRRAAALGDPAAMFNVGVSYDSGIGVGRDHREAARWYGRAASRHHGRAEYDLALMYRAGDGVPRSPAAAARLFQAAARDGVGAASAYLPRPLPDRPRRSAAPAPTPDPPDDDGPFLQAQRALLSRRPQEAAEAVVLFRQAAAAPGPAAAPALYDLGWCYENGVGVPADPSRAYQSYVRAAAVTDDHDLRDLAEGAAVALHAPSTAAPPAAVPPGR